MTPSDLIKTNFGYRSDSIDEDVVFRGDIDSDRREVDLSGRHPNSSGRTVAVVDRILTDPSMLDALFDCYDFDDSVVRLRLQ